MQQESRQKIEYIIKNNRLAIKKKGPKIAWAQDLKLRHKMQESNELKINDLLQSLQEYHSELFPFVKKIKSHINDITESSHVCAIYLLQCHIFDNWNSFFLLAKNGKNSAAGNLLRMIKEATMIVNLFAVEFASGSRTSLDKWFLGEIIGQKNVEKKWENISLNIHLILRLI